MFAQYQRIMGEITLRHQLITELEKASPEMLRQLFDFLQFLKRAEKSVSKSSSENESIKKFIGCLSEEDGATFAASIENEFNKIEGEW